MKKTHHLSFAFLLFSIHINSFLSAADIVPSPVVDTTGEILQTGVEYYILPVIRGRGGGLTLRSTANQTCPPFVAQRQLEVDNGIPLTFSPVDTKDGIIRVSTDLNIRFSAFTICIVSNVWRLDSYDESTQQYFIVTDGVEGNPGPETISNWFKIEKYGDDYKLVYCPTVCDFCRVICRDVGVFGEDENRRLVLSDDPFRVMFKKAESEALSTSE